MILPTFISFARTLILLSVGVSGQLLRNITLDDTDPAIKYTGPGWQVDPDYPASYYQRACHLSNQSGAYATFSFTGVAVYYLAPLYELEVSTLLSLDSGPAQLVNLTGVSFGSVNYYAVRWSATGLTDGTHTVPNTLGRSAQGELAMWAIIDGFIYTVRDPPTPSVGAPTTVTVSGGPSSVPVGAITTVAVSGGPSSVPVGAIVGGTVGGVVFVLLLAFFAFFLIFKKSFQAIRNASVGEDPNGQSGSNPQMRDQDGLTTY